MSIIKPVNDFLDKDIQDDLLKVIEKAYNEVLELLPGLPDTLGVYFDNGDLIPELGVGACAWDPETLTIGFDLKFKGDKVEQIKELKHAIFHEAYHLAHGWTIELNKAIGDRHGLAIEQAFYEGCAIVFERDYSGAKDIIGNYSKLENIEELFAELNSLQEDYDVNAWKFWHKEKRERWLLYRVGTWMIDEYLKKNKDKTILDLLKLKPEDVIKDLEK
jgi:hypothetical protein